MLKNVMKLFLFCFWFSAVSIAGSAKNMEAGLAIVKGSFVDYKPGEMYLFKSLNGSRVKCGTAKVTADGGFGLVASVREEGMYYLSDESRWWMIRVYLKPGDNLELKFTRPGYYELVDGSEENKLLSNWFNKVSRLRVPGSDLPDTSDAATFCKREKEVKAAAVEFRNSFATSDEVFNAELRDIIEIDLDNAAFRFCLKSGTAFPQTGEIGNILKDYIRPGKYSSAGLLRLGEATELLGLYCKALSKAGSSSKNGDGSAILSLPEECKNIVNDTLKGAYAVTRFSGFQHPEEVKEQLVPLEKLMLLAYQKAAYAKKLDEVNPRLAKGSPEIDIALPDLNGKTVRLSDFKGKVVLIDVWASWSGFYIKDLGELEAVKKRYKDKNIEFISVSLDTNPENWKKCIEEYHIGGVQLIAPGLDNEFVHTYCAAAVPRLVLIDKDGIIVTANAPWPSDGALVKMLDSVL